MIIGKMASSVDPDEMAHYEPSHLDLHCLHWYLYRSTGLTELKGIFKVYTVPISTNTRIIVSLH